MRTRTPKSGAKKTPPSKKAPAKGTKAAAAAAAAAAPTPADPKPESNEVEESAKSLAPDAANPEKSQLEDAGKGKRLTSPSADAVKPEEAEAEAEEPMEEAKTEADGSPVAEEAEEVKEEPVEEAVDIKEEAPKEEEMAVDEAKEEAEEVPRESAGIAEVAGEAELAMAKAEVATEGKEVVEEGKEAEGGEGAEGKGEMEEPAEKEHAGEGREDGAEEDEEAHAEEEEQKEISDMAKKRKIKKEQEIFVGGLDRDATEEDVRKAFEKIGEVVEVRLHRDFATNKNKGFAFVMFTRKELADKALAEMKNPVIHGKRCGIAASEDNDTLFLGNICNTWTKEAIKRKLKDYGIEGLENITLVEDTQHEGLSRGFAFLEFSCHADAMAAYKRLQKPDVVFGHPERTAKVAFAEPLREPDAEVMAQVKSVFVDGMPPYWDEDRVKEQFKGYGQIERVVLARNMTTAKRKDFGFVNFSTHDAAVVCVQGVNNTELGDGKNKAKVRARLANPLPKTQAVKGGMRGGFRIGHTVGGPSRSSRGFGRGRFQQNRGGFLGGRGFHPRGRGGRFPFSDNDFSHSQFHGRRPFGGRGGRRGGFGHMYEGPVDEFAPYPSRGGAFGNVRGRFFQARRPGYPSDGEFGGPSDGWQFGEDPYFYGDVGPGAKRPYSMMEHDSGYLEPGRRLYPRYDYSEGSSARYRDMNQAAGGTYSAGAPYSEYYDPNFDSRGYSSFYGSDQPGGGHYY